MKVIGCDPGGRETGLILRDGDTLLGHTVVVREGDAPVPQPGDPHWPRFLHTVATTIRGWRTDRDTLVTVEGLEDWMWASDQSASGGRRRRNMRGLFGTAAVLGVVLLAERDAIVVPPGAGHGGGEAWVYPEAIRPPKGGKGSDRLRHCRSAWDLSFHGEQLWRRMQIEREAI